MKKSYFTICFVILGLVLFSCKKETREKLKAAKQSVSNAGTLVKNANDLKENIEKLQKATPLTNEQLKAWLPKELHGMQRKSFKVGAGMYANIASIEGKFDTPDEPTHINDDEGYRMANPDKKSFSVILYDGAGPTGGMMISGLGMAAKMDFEEESEYEHKKTMSYKGIKAVQILKKPRTPSSAVKVQLQFVYEGRFGIMANSTNMTPEETWEIIEMLGLDKIADEAS